MRFVCPKCRTSNGLWRGVDVSGWQAIGDDLSPDSYRGRGLDREVDWAHVVPDGTYGCGECQWEGVRSELVRLGIDGMPLPEPNPAQGQLI
jgi:hypothetical protein